MRAALAVHRERIPVPFPPAREAGEKIPPWLGLWEISPDELDGSRILDSAFAAPGRYLLELHRRAAHSGEPVAVINPTLPLSPTAASRLIESLPEAGEGALVARDDSGRPLLYLLPGNLEPTCERTLCLLSCVDAGLDADLLRLSLLAPVEVLELPAPETGQGSNGFYAGAEQEGIRTWLARHAVTTLGQALGRAPGDPAPEPDERHKLLARIAALPMAAIMPHHAGDVLFLAMAAARAKAALLFDEALIQSGYLDIFASVPSPLAPLALDHPPPRREGRDMTEEEYFFEMAKALPEETTRGRLLAWLRPSRNYQTTIFHLVDHFAFALGAPMASRDGLFHFSAPKPPERRPETPDFPPYRVLLHLAGGWPIKTYPAPLADSLIRALRALGCRLTLITEDKSAPGLYEARQSRTMDELSRLMAEHHLFIGIDSYPAHHAAHVLGFPAICLFGNTRPANSNAPMGPAYAHLAGSLSCAGCGSYSVCKVYGGEACRNFPEPAEVAALALKTLQRAYAPALGGS